MATPRRIAVFGAHRQTGNLGVSALADGALAGIFDRAPEAQVSMFVDARNPRKLVFRHATGDHAVIQFGISYSKNPLRPNHLLPLLAKAALVRVLGRGRLRRRILDADAALAALCEADVALDISGGDSFTDLYGPYRMFLQSLMKSLVLISGTKLVLLPQTIGPFRTRLARAVAGAILRRASAVYCRDSESLAEAERVAGPRRAGCLRYAADMSFLVEPEKPEDVATVDWAEIRRRDGVLVGLNVSGLLAGGGYTGRNQFGLRGDYTSVVVKAAGALLAEENVSLLFLPHVFGQPGAMENDLDASRSVAALLSEDTSQRTCIPDGLATAGQAKHLAGMCEFFAGSRMHSCLGALSQGVPTVGIAYSRKFQGVFDSLGVGDMVVDFTQCDEATVVERLLGAFRDRKRIRDRLTVPVEEAKASTRAALGEILDAVEGGS